MFCGLQKCLNPDFVLIHDGARPLINPEIIDKSIDNAVEKGATLVAVPTKDTIKTVNNNLEVVTTPDRAFLWNVQTPQIFKFPELFNAHEMFKQESLTDDSALIEKMGN